MNEALLLMGCVILLCTLMGRYLDRLAVPSLLIFIALGMCFGENGLLRIPFDDYDAANVICSASLIFIMFYGGFGTNLNAARPVVVQSVVLSTLGVAGTAGAVAVFAHLVLGLPWVESFLIGSVISSTDAASVFNILRSKKLALKYHTDSLLEMESGSNDPMSYMLTAVAIALLVALGVLKPMGAMKKAYERAQATGRLYSEESDALNTDDGEEAPLDSVKTKKLLAGFIIPLAVFIVIVLVNGDVVLGSLVTIAVAFVLFLALRLARWNELMKACMQGITDMVPMIVIVFAAYMVRDSLIAIGMPEYVISIAQPFMSPALLPVITFVICALLASMSGTNWGSTLPVAAVVIPLCASVGGNMPMVLSAVISGAAFGAHACFYCDVTIFTSGMTKIDNMEHATTQLPYCLIGAGVTTLLYLVAGFLF